jgi:hypothetical protein
VRRRQIVLGGIFVVWGAAIVVRGLVKGIPDPGAGSYSAGQFAAFVFGFVMIAVGARALLKNTDSRRLGPMAVMVMLAAGVVVIVGGYALWNHLRVDRASALAVKYGAATSEDEATLADRCIGVMHEEYNTTDDPGIAGVPPKAFATLVPEICELGVERGLVDNDGTMSEQAGFDLTGEVAQRMGTPAFQQFLADELVVQYRLASPAETNRWHRCVALAYAGWDAQPSKEHLPPRELFRRAARETCTLAIDRGLIPESGAPALDSPNVVEFQNLFATILQELLA